jgi:hypothetical protein
LRRLLLAGLVLAGCTVTAPQPTPSARASRAPSPSPAASAKPTLLARPAGQVTVLSGQVTLDANYIVAQGAGNVISTDGSSLINNGGSTLAVEEGNAIIGNDGASLINDGGSTLINNGGSTYQLQAAATVPLGQLLPVAGAQLAVRSLDTGELLPLGRDAAGKPVTTIVSNRQGRFEVYLPAGGSGNVRVEAAFKAGDGVARYASLTANAAGACQVDEDTHETAEFERDAFAGRLASLSLTSEAVLLELGDLAPFAALIKPFHDVAVGLSAERLRAATLRCADVLMARPGALQHPPAYDLPGADPALMAQARSRNEARGLSTAGAIMTDSFRTIRRAAVARMRLEPEHEAYFDQLPAVAAYRSLLAPTFHIRRASDVVAFVTIGYLTPDYPDDGGVTMPERTRFAAIASILEGRPIPPGSSIGRPWAPIFAAEPSTALATGLGDDALQPGEACRMSSGTRAFTATMLEQLFLQEDSDQLRERLLAIYRGS